MRRLEYKWIVGVVFVFGLFMDLLDMTIVNVAIPTLAHDFDASTTTIQWVVTGYLLSLAVFIPVSGWAGDRFGTKRVFMFALSVFVTASLLCGLACSIESLIAFARSRTGVEFYVEPETFATDTTAMAIAADGEWTRRRVGSPSVIQKVARDLRLPVYDVQITGYPQRMRDFNERRRRQGGRSL